MYLPINGHLPIKQPLLQEIKPVHDHAAKLADIF